MFCLIFAQKFEEEVLNFLVWKVSAPAILSAATLLMTSPSTAFQPVERYSTPTKNLDAFFASEVHMTRKAPKSHQKWPLFDFQTRSQPIFSSEAQSSALIFYRENQRRFFTFEYWFSVLIDETKQKEPIILRFLDFQAHVFAKLITWFLSSRLQSKNFRS